MGQDLHGCTRTIEAIRRARDCCANRRLVETLWARLKEWRAIATRYENTAQSFLGVLCLAATADWIKVSKL